MLRSMFSAVAGLKAHQTKLDVVGNNIANVNTVGYKSSQTVFEDTLSQVLRNGSAPTADSAGTNPAQVGLGVQVAGITTNFTQGAQQNTGRASDFMIGGDGFFVTQSGTEQTYTRAGSFDFDGAGHLVTPDGGILQGWMAKDGVVDPNGALGPLSIQFGQALAPTATTASALTGNLSADPPADPANPTTVQTQAKMFDSLGIAHQVSYKFTKGTPDPVTGVTTWKLDVQDESGATMLAAPIDVTFDATGKMTAPTDSKFTFTPMKGTDASWPDDVTVDLSGLTQSGGKSSAAVTYSADSGSAPGTLQSFALSGDGTIMGVYSNGLRQPIGQLALANFSNPGGLEKAGNSAYRVGDNSGSPAIGVAGSGGRGTLTAGALEMSNVDLAEEFTGLIIAQRGFQANSRVITTSDQVLQELVNLKQ